MIERIAVYGAGLMGSGIAQVAAQSGFKVALVDLSVEILNKSFLMMQRNLEKRAILGKIASDDIKKSLERIDCFTSRQQAAKGADFVIEAIPERIDLKIELFRQIDAVCRPEVIFATNTSALSISELGAATNRLEQFIGMHFFNPVPAMKLVEIVKGARTNDQTATIAAEVAQKMPRFAG